MRAWNWYSKAAFALVLLAFAYWVWPTPWRVFRQDGVNWRVNRFTERTQRFDDWGERCGWTDDEHR